MNTQKVEEIVRQALSIADVFERDRYLRNACGTATTSQPIDASGRYNLREEIARGGMGAIYRGFDNQLRRDLAIKVLLSENEANTEMVGRFVDEAQIHAQLQHPGIVPIYDVGFLSDKRPFFSMKLIDGKTLETLLKERGNLETELSGFLKTFELVCQTVAYAHSRKIVHRDLKPSNIMVGKFGEVQVMDWGIAKSLATSAPPFTLDTSAPSDAQETQSLFPDSPSGDTENGSSRTRMGAILGTPSYIAPEQAKGIVGAIDFRTDVFGLGAILCEILTGDPPYIGKGNTPIRLAWNADQKDMLSRLEKCGADSELITLTKECLAPNPAHRPLDAGIVARRLNDYFEGVQRRLRETELAMAEEVARSGEAVRRRGLYRAIAGLLAVLFVSVSVAAVIFLEQNRELELKNKDVLSASETRRQLLYASDMQMASLVWEREEMSAASFANLLQDHIPRSDENDQRGFEWYYHQGLLHSNSVSLDQDSVAMSIRENGDLVLITDKLEIQIRDSVSGAMIKSLSIIANAKFDHIALGPQGRQLAVVTSSTISIYDCDNGELLHTLTHPLNFFPPRFSDDGRFLLAAKDLPARRKIRSIVRFDLAGGLQEEFALKDDWTWAEVPRCLSSKNWMMGMVHPKDPTIRRTGLAISQYDLDPEKSESLQVYSDFGKATLGEWATNDLGDFLVTSLLSRGLVALHDLKSENAEIQQLEHASVVSSTCLSTDCRYLATGTTNGLIKIWSLEQSKGVTTANFVRSLKGHLNAVRFLTFSSDSERLISSDGESVRIWDLSLKEDDGFAPQIEGRCNDVAFSPNGKFLAVTLGAGNTVQMRNAANGEVRWSREVEAAPVSVAFSNDSKQVAFGLRECRISIFAVDTGELVGSWNGNDERESVLAMDFSPDNQDLAVGFGLFAAHNSSIRKRPCVIHLSSGKIELTLEKHDNACPTIRYAKSGTLVWTTSHLGKLTCWDRATGKVVREFDNPEEDSEAISRSIESMDLSKDGSTLAFASEGGSVYLLGLNSDTFSSRQFVGHTGSVLGVSFSPDGRTLASASADGTVRLWHIQTGREMHRFSSGISYLTVRFSPDGKQLVAGGIRDNKLGSSVDIWRIPESELWRHP